MDLPLRVLESTWKNVIWVRNGDRDVVKPRPTRTPRPYTRRDFDRFRIKRGSEKIYTLNADRVHLVSARGYAEQSDQRATEREITLWSPGRHSSNHFANNDLLL